jgi:hypothetical protein
MLRHYYIDIIEQLIKYKSFIIPLKAIYKLNLNILYNDQNMHNLI